MLGLEEKKKPALKRDFKNIGFRTPNLGRPEFLPLRFKYFHFLHPHTKMKSNPPPMGGSSCHIYVKVIY